MGNTTSSRPGQTHNDLLTPLYSNGTSEMDSSKNMGACEGPKSPPAVDTSNVTVHNFGKD